MEIILKTIGDQCQITLDFAASIPSYLRINSKINTSTPNEAFCFQFLIFQ